MSDSVRTVCHLVSVQLVCKEKMFLQVQLLKGENGRQKDVSGRWSGGFVSGRCQAAGIFLSRVSQGRGAPRGDERVFGPRQMSTMLSAWRYRGAKQVSNMRIRLDQ